MIFSLKASFDVILKRHDIVNKYTLFDNDEFVMGSSEMNVNVIDERINHRRFGDSYF